MEGNSDTGEPEDILWRERSQTQRTSTAPLHEQESPRVVGFTEIHSAYEGGCQGPGKGTVGNQCFMGTENGRMKKNLEIVVMAA